MQNTKIAVGNQVPRYDSKAENIGLLNVQLRRKKIHKVDSEVKRIAMALPNFGTFFRENAIYRPFGFTFILR